MNVAVFLPNWIGDAVMATPAVRALRHLCKGRLVAVCKPYIQGVIDGSPWFDRVLHLDSAGPWSRRWPAAAWRLRSEKVDVAVLFPNSFRSALTARLGGCRRLVGFNRYLRGPLLTDRLEPVRDAAGRFVPSPVIDDYNRLAQTAGCRWPGHVMELFTTPGGERAAEDIWCKYAFEDDDEVICLNPGAAFGASKYWSTEHFATLAQELVDRRGAKVLVLCGPSERDLSRHIARLAARPQVRSIADEPLSLELTKAVLRRASLLVTTDSGPRHIAAAFDRPVVTLFGPTHIAWTETYFPRAINLKKKVPCGPCQKRVCPLDHQCMKELLPRDVFAAVDSLLALCSPPRFQREAS